MSHFFGQSESSVIISEACFTSQLFVQCEPFLEPVDTKEFSDYLDYVFHPMDIGTLEKKIKKKTYGSTEVLAQKSVVTICRVFLETKTHENRLEMFKLQICNKIKLEDIKKTM